MRYGRQAFAAGSNGADRCPRRNAPRKQTALQIARAQEKFRGRAWRGRMRRSAACRISSPRHSSCTGSREKKSVSSEPTRAAVAETPVSRSAEAIPSPRRFARASERFVKSRALQADRATRFPRSSPADFRKAFPPGTPGPSGATRSIKSRRPPYAATGSPPPMILPSVVRSGVMPNIVCAPP